MLLQDFEPEITSTPAYVSAGVTDGVTVGHPCFSIQDCIEPQRDHHQQFCQSHLNLSKNCTIQGCLSKAEAGHLTCRESTHHTVELNRVARGKAIFQLQKCLQNVGIAGTRQFLLPYLSLTIHSFSPRIIAASALV